MYDENEPPIVATTYTIPEAAEALGRSVSNIRRWLDRDWIPAPHLRDASRGLAVYSQGELEVIRQELEAHEREYAYYGQQHEGMRHRMFQRIQGYRARFI